ncbi:hypothetical protein EUZ85_14420 [Hahella sp. KA22]|uniref:hypothetical protein n=1 Tax=Hahella sp. KA22 TaxID=1628392 RepID=UPI000FDD98A0|nr:hypothetical protein [Hahella sp. KA22]AZZ91859.1 hypothetical protein ENC22_11855 [Hahella sp. KA22]QAY55230.1 hypothetical protein EUZ85_14420 [Hahella sp. KA22]
MARAQAHVFKEDYRQTGHYATACAAFDTAWVIGDDETHKLAWREAGNATRIETAGPRQAPHFS